MCFIHLMSRSIKMDGADESLNLHAHTVNCERRGNYICSECFVSRQGADGFTSQWSAYFLQFKNITDFCKPDQFTDRRVGEDVGSGKVANG